LIANLRVLSVVAVLLLQDRVKFHVLLTTYEMVSKHLADIRRLDWCALLVDEAHRLKNANSRLFQVRWLVFSLSHFFFQRWMYGLHC
jgi:hypothetical protein